VANVLLVAVDVAGQFRGPGDEGTVPLTPVLDELLGREVGVAAEQGEHDDHEASRVKRSGTPAGPAVTEVRLPT
jgi:hypothetical protein